MERLESDDLLEGDRRYQGLSKEKREEYEDIFKEDGAKDGAHTVELRMAYGPLNSSTALNGGGGNNEVKSPTKRKIFMAPSTEKKDKKL